jgi:peptidoglycan/xylan/chitin deacetylase (PgdA/CDA1 family)
MFNRRLSPFHIATALAIAAAAAAVWSGRLWLAASVLTAYAVMFALGVAFIRMNFFCAARCRGRRGGNFLTLTFDDGPDPAATPALLDTLRDLRVPAAFFCVGERVRMQPELARRIVREGHVIGNHSLRHGWWTNLLFGRRLREELLGAQEAIRAATGVTPRYYRSPVGLTNTQLGAALRRADLLLVGWDVRALDRGAPRDKVVQRILRLARDGSIILLHDGGARPEVLTGLVRDVVAQLRARGYSFVGLDEMLSSR